MTKPTKPEPKQPKQLGLADLEHVHGGNVLKTRHDTGKTAGRHCRPD